MGLKASDHCGNPTPPPLEIRLQMHNIENDGECIIMKALFLDPKTILLCMAWWVIEMSVEMSASLNGEVYVGG